MATATLPAVQSKAGGEIAEVPPEIRLSTLEKLVVNGDVSRLSADERLQWYRARCLSAGLDPITQPFEYLTLQGKMVLYAKKTATDQLIAKHKLDVQILDRKLDAETGIYEVRCRVKFPEGRAVEDVGAIFVGRTQGNDLANMLMKGITKAKRRTVLSACGLGVLDESELESISGATRFIDSPAPAINNSSGHGTGKYASDEQVAVYSKRLREWIDRKNAEWWDRWQDPDTGEMPDKLPELLNVWQANNHLLKWCVETGRLDQGIVPEDSKVRQAALYVAVVYHRDPADRKALGAEMEHYAVEQARIKTDKVYRLHPELRPSEDETQEVGPEPDDPQREPGCDDDR